MSNGRSILAVAILSLYPSLSLAGIVYPSGTPIASGNVTIPNSPTAPESVIFPGVTLNAGQLYWVAVLPQNSNSGAFWAQNPGLGQNVAFSSDGVNWSDSGFGATAYPGEFAVKDGSGNTIYSNMTGDPFNTGHAWATSGATSNPSCSPNCFPNAYASYFLPTVSSTAAEVDVVLTQNSFTQGNQQITYDPNATVELFAANPQTVYNTTDAQFSLTGGSGDIESTVSGYPDGSGGTVGPYDYSYTINYSGDNQILAIPLLNSGDVYNIGLTGGAYLGTLSELPETVAQLFGSAYTDAVVINLPDSDSGNTISFSFDSPYLPTDAQWDVIGPGYANLVGFDPPIPGSVPEPATLWLAPVVGAVLLWRRRRTSLVA